MKKTICLLLLMCMVLTVPYSAYALTDTPSGLAAGEWNPDMAAELLGSLKMLSKSNGSYNLDLVPSRTEISIMLIRMLGAEAQAKALIKNHPFTDVPAWADAYVTYMYQNKLSSGIGNNKFGATVRANAMQYVAFVLRALGYSEGAGDFKTAGAVDKAVELGILTPNDKINLEKSFTRGGMAIVTLRAFSARLKGTEITLMQRLVEKGVCTIEDANRVCPPAAPREILEFKEGFSVILRKNTACLFIDRSQLPKTLQDACYVGFGTTSDARMTEETLAYLKNATGKRETFINDKAGMTTGNMDTSQNELVTLYDTWGRLIAYSIVQHGDRKSSDPHYFMYLADFNGKEITQGVDFIVKRFVNGVEDKEYPGAAYSIKGTLAADGSLLGFAQFDCGPIYKPDDSVSYELIPLNPNLKNIRIVY